MIKVSSSSDAKLQQGFSISLQSLRINTMTAGKQNWKLLTRKKDTLKCFIVSVDKLVKTRA